MKHKSEAFATFKQFKVHSTAGAHAREPQRYTQEPDDGVRQTS